MQNSHVLKMSNISKEYYGVRVLNDISLEVKKGEIHALLGENGAGKSTLMNILFGMPVIHGTGGFEGIIEIDGKHSHISSPNMAMEYGIGMVHQEFMLIPGFTVAENIKIGREVTKPNLVSRILGKPLESLDFPIMLKDAEIALDKVGLDISAKTSVGDLPVGYLQFIEIARELDKTGIKLLVFDEPTAVLTESEAKKLLGAMKTIAESGIAIIFITHRLDEVMEVADNITILRDGHIVGHKEKKDTSAVELGELMIGREIEERNVEIDILELAKRKIALSFKNYSVSMPGEKVVDLNLDIHEGEIFGIGGLAGQGKIGIPNGIMSMYPASGQVQIFEKDFPLNKLGAALNEGVAFVSEDRREVGLLLDSSIEDNIVFTAMQVNNEFLKFGFRDGKSIRKFSKKMIEELDIRTTGSIQAVGRLSGGNQQKVCLARAIASNPKILIVSEPTRGIDVGAKELVLNKLIEINKEKGMTIIIISSELAELRSVCSRIAIIASGKVAKILKADDADSDFGLAMSGMTRESAKK